MARRWFVICALIANGCDSPQLVSFNTPELCEPEVDGLPSFTVAVELCEGACQLCIESEINAQALTYFVSHESNCVCPAPAKISSLDAGSGPAQGAMALMDAGDAASTIPGEMVGALDAATSSGMPDASSATSSPDTVGPGADGCESRLHLTKSDARAFCDDKDDCHVCVERIDFDGEARAYMAHQCGCPDPYRVD